jgi:TonB-linked SusC/RagA family outer membrane protein
MYKFHETKEHNITAYAQSKAINLWHSERTQLNIKRLMMRVKLVCLTCMIVFLQVSFAANAQKISLAKKGASITDILWELRAQSGYDFLINQNQINISKPITLNVTNASLTEVLDQCFKNQPIAYSIENNMIVVVSKQKQSKVIETAFLDLNGRIVDEKGLPLIGASIKVKGSTQATVADIDGRFIFKNIAPNAVLSVSFIGYVTQEINVAGKTTVVIKLVPDASSLNEVVVTALGIKRSEKSLSYASQQVNGNEVTKVKTDNLMNALSGKVAGLSVSSNASGLGGSVKVIMRGNKSASGSNQPLYVVDGVPLANNSNNNGQPNSIAASAISSDGGDGISNLNPDDIESITVLRGASASALYGSQAANGVILITTKKGTAGKTQVHFSSLVSLSRASYLPKFQNNYGQTPGGSSQSYGPKIDNGGADNLGLYFKTGADFTNSLSISSGSEKAQTYFSYANTSATGIQPGNKLSRNNFLLRETSKMLNDKLTLDGSANFINQKINNTPIFNNGFNALPGLYLFPRGLDITTYKDNFETPDVARGGLKTQNWPFSEALQQNPWWVTYRDPNFLTRNRIILNFSAKYDVNNWLSIQARGNMDRGTDNYEQDAYAGTSLKLIQSINGQLVTSNQTNQQIYSDALAIFKIPTKSDFSINAVLGTSITDKKTEGYKFGPGLGLFIPNIFIQQNVVLQNSGTTATGSIPAIGSNVSTIPAGHNQIQSVFASGDISYKDYLFLTLSGRNDWSSNLAFTPNGSYFYPAVGLSFLLSQAVKLPEVINYAKLRASYAQVGNTVGTYATYPLNQLGAGGSVVNNGVAPLPLLKPEKTNSFEYGTDLGLFKNRLKFNLTYYKTNTINQFYNIIPAISTGYTVGYVNAGDIQNTGLESTLAVDVIKKKDLVWNSYLNFSTNKNLIIDVDSKDGIDQFLLTEASQNYESTITKGGSFGDIYGTKLATDDQGRVIIGASGLPSLASSAINGSYFNLGNTNPKFQVGFGNSVDFKGLSLSVLVGGQFGGHVYSATQSNLDIYGVSKASGDARDAGGVVINGVDPSGNPVTSIDAKKWYSVAGQAVGNYIYSATVVRLKEASLSYRLPIKNTVFKSVSVGLTGRNLLYFYKKAPSDPELSLSSGNGLSGLDFFGLPSTRNYGFNLNVIF